VKRGGGEGLLPAAKVSNVVRKEESRSDGDVRYRFIILRRRPPGYLASCLVLNEVFVIFLYIFFTRESKRKRPGIPSQGVARTFVREYFVSNYRWVL